MITSGWENALNVPSRATQANTAAELFDGYSAIRMYGKLSSG